MNIIPSINGQFDVTCIKNICYVSQSCAICSGDVEHHKCGVLLSQISPSSDQTSCCVCPLLGTHRALPLRPSSWLLSRGFRTTLCRTPGGPAEFIVQGPIIDHKLVSIVELSLRIPLVPINLNDSNDSTSVSTSRIQSVQMKVSGQVADNYNTVLRHTNTTPYLYNSWGPPQVKVKGGGGQRKLDWASDWNVTKLLCINKVKCHKMLI